MIEESPSKVKSAQSKHFMINYSTWFYTTDSKFLSKQVYID